MMFGGGGRPAAGRKTGSGKNDIRLPALGGKNGGKKGQLSSSGVRLPLKPERPSDDDAVPRPALFGIKAAAWRALGGGKRRMYPRKVMKNFQDRDVVATRSLPWKE